MGEFKNNLGFLKKNITANNVEYIHTYFTLTVINKY